MYIYLFTGWYSRKQKDQIKTEGKHLSTPFPRLYLTPSQQISAPCLCNYLRLHTVPLVRQQTWMGWVPVSTQQFSLLLLLPYTFALLQSGLSTGHLFLWNIYLLQHGVFHRLKQLICCVMEHLPPPLTLVWPLMFITLSSNPTPSWLFLPFPECACTGDTGLADGPSCVLQWVHSEDKWIWHGAYLGLNPQKPPCRFHPAHIYTKYMVLHMWCNNSGGCKTPSSCSSQ